jgi:hypothetical protein
VSAQKQQRRRRGMIRQRRPRESPIFIAFRGPQAQV